MRTRSVAALRWAGFGKNIFSEMTELARSVGAVNLAQGFPDEVGPQRILQALRLQLESGIHQYAPYIGEEQLRKAVAGHIELSTGLQYNHKSEITITTGATEAIYVTLNAFVNPGDRVVVFDPSFDTYAQAVANAGGVLVPIKLHAPDSPLGIRFGGWAIDWEEFDEVSRSGYSFLILNSPHNPTAKVFGAEELLRIAASIDRNNAVALSDEVYEHILFDDAEHISLASFPIVRNRVVRVSSVAKTFGFTGFKLGWVAACPALTDAVRLVHQAVVFCTPSHIQLAFADVLLDEEWTQSWIQTQNRNFANRRTRLAEAFKHFGFRVEPSQGTYFLLANYDEIDRTLDGMSFARKLAEERKVACIPVSAFSQTPSHQSFWLRFAFCKSEDSIARVEKLLSHSVGGISVL